MPLSLPEVQRLDRSVEQEIQRRLNNLTKPLGSLGRLETLVLEFGAMRGTADIAVKEKAVFTFAADHGVARSGVSAYPREVTAQMVLNFLKGGAAINVLCRHYGIRNVVIDVGVDYEFGDPPGLISRKIARGTANFAETPAMTREQAIRSIEAGIDLPAGYDLIGTGEMGIGNTTPSTAILAVFSGLPPEEVVGRGTGIDDQGLKQKAVVIRRALDRLEPDRHDPLDVLAKVGGFEIGAIAGLILGAASRRIPIVVDGFISGAGALIATRLEPACQNYLFFSHVSRERGHRAMLELLGARSMLDLDMCLGEGTGAAIAMDLISVAVRLYNEMATFESAAVSKS